MVSVYWGTNDPGPTTVGWDNAYPFDGSATNGPYGTNVTLPFPNVTYYYAFYASNSAGSGATRLVPATMARFMFLR